MDTEAFLKSVVTTERGWFCLLIGPPDRSGWHEEWFEWPHGLEHIVARAQEAAPANNVYFTSHLFEIKSSTKDNVLPSGTIQCDLDDAEVPLSNSPTVVVETSPGRHQAYWVLREPLQPQELEQLSKQLTYSIPDADRSGWSLGHKMRLPGTYNHKYPGTPRPVKVVSSSRELYKSLHVQSAKVIELAEPTIESFEPAALETGVRELWASVRNKLPRKVVAQYDRVQPDRSAALWGLMLSLFRAGCSRDEVFWLAKASANNKFGDNRYHADLDLSKDVLRAERSLHRADSPEDIRSRISEARRLPGVQSEKRAYIAALVRDSMAQLGSFVGTDQGTEWFIREDTGRPIPLTRSNDYLSSFLEITYGLNATEPEQRYTVNSLIAHTKERGARGHLGVLSYYDKQTNAVLIHGGRKEVFYVDSTSVVTVANGHLGVVFPWVVSSESFEPDLKRPRPIDDLFNDCFDNLDDFSPAEALALMKAWLYFLVFRNEATARPLIALLGQPGSGKSTLFRRIYAFIYGQSKSLNSITTADDFDHAVASDPIVVFDNVDTWTGWLPDKLALSAASSDLVKRKLYTDVDTIVLKRQALVGLTAHNPKFRREDIVDRLLMFNFHRLDEAVFKSESEIIADILVKRDGLWGGFTRDIQKILGTPRPSQDEVPHMRVNDFARIGLWIARALGFEADFRRAVTHNVKEQISFNLEEEEVLIDTIAVWLNKTPDTDRYFSSGDLWARWQLLARDTAAFNRLYHNAVSLGKKLWALQATLGNVFDVDYELDANGVRKWRFRLK